VGYGNQSIFKLLRGASQNAICDIIQTSGASELGNKKLTCLKGTTHKPLLVRSEPLRRRVLQLQPKSSLHKLYKLHLPAKNLLD